MSLPHLLLVDDSEAVLAFETAALSGHYTINTARNGREALDKIAKMRPDGVLLDLSMPEVDGVEVLLAIRASASLRDVPVVVISSEIERAEACLSAGADAYLAKPIRADELLVVVGRVLEDSQRRRRVGGLACLFVVVGPLEIAFPLDAVRQVLQLPATRALPGGPAYLCEYFELEERPVLVIDLAVRLGVAHSEPLLERQLVVVGVGEIELALCVDRIADPAEIPTADVIPHGKLGGSDHGDLREMLTAVVRTARGCIPVIAPTALLAPALLEQLGSIVHQVSSLPWHPPPPDATP